MLTQRQEATPWLEALTCKCLPAQAYKNYIHTILTRKNTINGRTYLEDPNILSLELANEPHTSDNYEISRGIAPGSLVKAWVSEMAAYIRSLDPNHMVSESFCQSLPLGSDHFFHFLGK